MKMLFDNFDMLAESPGGVEKLRKMILQLAVQGQLVSQYGDEAPALELLGDIAGARGLSAKSTPPLDSNNDAGRLPLGWAKCTLSDTVTILNGRAYKKQELLDKGTPVLRVGNLFTSKQWYYSDLDLDGNKYIDRGDLIYAWSASFGPFIWSGERVIYHYHIWKMVLHVDDERLKRYLYLFLLEKTAEIRDAGHGISMLHMTKAKMEQLELLLPPIEEQARIVAKVDSLMSLCDEIEKQQQKKARRKLSFSKASLFALNTSENKQEFAKNWETITENFDLLYSTPENVNDLKQTILQLAVQGKLTEKWRKENPNVEPASALLEKIAKEKEKLIKEGKIKRQKPLPEIAEEEKPFELPEGWEWVRFADVCIIQSNLVKPEKFATYPHIAPNHIEKHTGRLLEYTTVKEDGVTSAKHLFEAGQILYSKIRNRSRPLVNVLSDSRFGRLCII